MRCLVVSAALGVRSTAALICEVTSEVYLHFYVLEVADALHMVNKNQSRPGVHLSKVHQTLDGVGSQNRDAHNCLPMFASDIFGCGPTPMCKNIKKSKRLQWPKLPLASLCPRLCSWSPTLGSPSLQATGVPMGTALGT